MFFLRSIRRQPEFREGVRNMAPVALGIGAWGLMTGVAMVKSGMSVFESVAMTLLVYAGSSQLASIPRTNMRRAFLRWRSSMRRARMLPLLLAPSCRPTRASSSCRGV